MIKKVLIPLYLNEVAPRFDLATEALIVTLSQDNRIEEERTVVLPQASSEKLCHLVLTENIHTVICGAIEDEYYQFLRWKKIEVCDSVAGLFTDLFTRFLDRRLKSGDILWARQIEGRHV
ncbi:NifB/NifX family molybdenum-iron cluster-binding protein [Desulfatiferula olefinivorans]